MTTNDPPGICQLTGERCPPECSATFQPCAAARGDIKTTNPQDFRERLAPKFETLQRGEVAHLLATASGHSFEYAMRVVAAMENDGVFFVREVASDAPTEALLAAHETGRLAGHQECRVAVAVLRGRCEQQAVTLEMYRKNAAGSALQAQQQHEELERLRAELAKLRAEAERD